MSPRKPSGRRPKSFRLEPDVLEWLKGEANFRDVAESNVVEHALRRLRMEVDHGAYPAYERRPKDSTRRREPEPEKPSWA